MRHALALVGLTLVTALPAQAQAPVGRIDALAAALQLPQTIQVMRDEGKDYGLEIEDEMFPGRGGPAWAALLDDLYDADRLEGVVRARLDAELSGVALAPLEQFFASDRGARIVGMEVSARVAMLDDSVEEAANEAAAEMAAARTPRYELLEEFADVNDLVETNVVGALNASFAFYDGLAEGGAFGESLTHEQILSDVWGQEPEVRAETEQWVMSYLALAYKPLSDDDLRAYIDISRSPEGQALNRALFAAFDEMYVGVSRGLGKGAAHFLNGQDL